MCLVYLLQDQHIMLTLTAGCVQNAIHFFVSFGYMWFFSKSSHFFESPTPLPPLFVLICCFLGIVDIHTIVTYKKRHQFILFDPSIHPSKHPSSHPSSVLTFSFPSHGVQWCPCPAVTVGDTHTKIGELQI